MLRYGDDDPRNTIVAPLAPGKSVSIFGSAVNFTRYFGTTYSDQPIEIVFAFSNEEVVLVPAGNRIDMINPMSKASVTADDRLPEEIRGVFPVVKGLRDATDEDLAGLNYDGIAQSTKYQPGQVNELVVTKAPIGDKQLVTIYGSALQVAVRNIGDKAIEQLRVFVRGSVF